MRNASFLIGNIHVNAKTTSKIVSIVLRRLLRFWQLTYLYYNFLHDVLPWFWLLRGGGGEESTEVARLDGGGHPPGLNVFQVGDNVVHHLPATDLELLAVHTQEVVVEFEGVVELKEDRSSGVG